MTLLSEIYDVTLKRENRGSNKEGWVRPTLGEFQMTHKDFQKIPRVLLGAATFTNGLFNNGVTETNGTDLHGVDGFGYALSSPTTPIASGKWTWEFSNYGSQSAQYQKVGVASVRKDAVTASYTSFWLYSIPLITTFQLFFDTDTGIFEVWYSGVERYKTTDVFPTDDEHSLVLMWTDSVSGGIPTGKFDFTNIDTSVSDAKFANYEDLKFLLS